MGKRKELYADINRRKIKQYIDAGYSLSKISKILNISYTHVKQISEQESDK